MFSRKSDFCGNAYHRMQEYGRHQMPAWNAERLDSLQRLGRAFQGTSDLYRPKRGSPSNCGWTVRGARKPGWLMPTLTADRLMEESMSNPRINYLSIARARPFMGEPDGMVDGIDDLEAESIWGRDHYSMARSA